MVLAVFNADRDVPFAMEQDVFNPHRWNRFSATGTSYPMSPGTFIKMIHGATGAGIECRRRENRLQIPLE
jgi:hypothetical protein